MSLARFAWLASFALYALHPWCWPWAAAAAIWFVVDIGERWDA